MSNSEKLYNAFAHALHIDPQRISDALAYNSIPEWDSVAHMALVAEIETVFAIMMDTDDIVDMSSVGKAKQIVAKHGIAF